MRAAGLWWTVWVLMGVVCAAMSEDLALLSMEQLRKLDRELDEKTAAVEQALVALEKVLGDLSWNETNLQSQLGDATAKREHERMQREQEESVLTVAKKEVQARRDDITRSSVHIDEIRRESQALSEKTADIITKTARAASHINEPSLSQVLDNKAEQWGEVPRSLYSKSQKVIGPAVSQLSVGADLFSTTASSTWKSLLLSLLMCMAVLGWLHTTYRIYVRLQGRVTIDRLMLVGDAATTVFWICTLVLALLLRKDPFEVMNTKSETLFLVLEMAMFLYYLGTVIVRVLVLAAHLSLQALGELIAVISVGHHYYISVWIPLVIGESVPGTFSHYAVYGCLYAILALLRIRTTPALEELLVNSRLGYFRRLRRFDKMRDLDGMPK